MIERLINSKFIQKLKNIKHIEIIVIMLFILLLLVIYFVNFGEKKDKTTSTQITNSTTIFESGGLLYNFNEDETINITQNYKNQKEQEITNLIKAATKNTLNINLILKGGEIVFSGNNNNNTELKKENISITVNNGITIIDYVPQIDKVIISNTQNLQIKDKLLVLDIVKNYLNINTNQILLY